MANRLLYSSESLDIHADSEKKLVRIELSSSGYRPKYVAIAIEDRDELERIIQALQEARSSLA
ncbi:hypothetical protein [Cohnella boryungensis]|uniref:Uncharacterized protein n=1 Tax=Cohnella boryungensis TaxID=768479 RepID=A0ABV8S403_9BACL